MEAELWMKATRCAAVDTVRFYSALASQFVPPMLDTSWLVLRVGVRFLVLGLFWFSLQ